ncbi:MAG: FtsX-like permease family protein, partial [Acidimicrobiia bacterium]
GYFGIALRLRHGAADLAAFKKAVQALPHQGAIEFQTAPVTEAKVARAVRPQVGALTAFALVIALTGLLLVGQAIARQTFLDSIDHPTMRALGFGRRQLVATAMLRALVVAVGAAALAVVVAVAASPLTPIGVARNAEPDLGLYVDGPVIALGFLAVVGAVLVLAAIPAWFYTRAARFRPVDQATRPSRVVGWLRVSGASLVAGTGVGMALEPGRGRTAVPVRTTIVGAALAIATVVAALTFAASLDHLVSTPRLYGWAWDARVETSGNSDAQTASVHKTVADLMTKSRSVAAFSESLISRVNLDGVTVTAVGVAHRKGNLGPTIVAGRAPRAADEVALGAKTLDRIGVGLGETVEAQPDAGGKPTKLRVVGRVVLPGLGTYPGSDKTALGEGALLTRAALRRLGPDFGPGPFLVALAPGSTRAALSSELAQPDATLVQVIGLQRPSDIVSYERVRTTPLVLAGVLALLAIATVTHALATAVRRRRRDLALLKTLGFTRRQVTGSVAWQATTFAVLALGFGIPIGVIVGRWVWTALADDLGTVAQPVVPVLALVVAIPVVLLIANAVAFVPGRIAARLRPATVLRTE